MFNSLIKALSQFMREFASDKTTRYFMNALKADKHTEVNGVEYAESVVDVVRTFITVVRCKTKNTSVVTPNGTFPVHEYSFPTNWWTLCRGVRVYTSTMAAESRKPYYELKKEDGNVLDPLQVSGFFNRFNAGQGDGDMKIQLSSAPSYFGDVVTISDFKALRVISDPEQMVMWNNAGSIEEVVAQVCGVPAYTDEEDSYLVPAMNEEGVCRWLMLTSGSKQSSE